MRWLAKISVFWLFVAFALAQKNTSDVVSVTYSYPKLTVSIAQPANLAVVLGKLCQETQSDCDGIELAGGSTAAPGIVRGTWNEVLDQLLQDSKLNYASSPPSASLHGRLIVQGNRLSLPAPAPVMQNPEPVAAAMVPEQPPTAAVNEPAPPSSDNTDSSAPIGGSVQTGGMGAPSMAQNNAASTETTAFQDSFRGGPRGSPFSPFPMDALPKASFSPFPDSHGNLMPIKNEPPLYSPFPDSHGNLMPIDPNQVGGSPFPLDIMRNPSVKILPR